MSSISNLTNGDSVKYWEGARQGRLLFQKCVDCGSVQFPPRHHCATCWKEELEWTESSGKGTIESFTIVRRAPASAFRDKVPYVIAAILIEEGPRMITNVVGSDALDVAIGDTVQVVFSEDSEGNVLPRFRRAP